MCGHGSLVPVEATPENTRARTQRELTKTRPARPCHLGVENSGALCGSSTRGTWLGGGPRQESGGREPLWAQELGGSSPGPEGGPPR